MTIHEYPANNTMYVDRLPLSRQSASADYFHVTLVGGGGGSKSPIASGECPEEPVVRSRPRIKFDSKKSFDNNEFGRGNCPFVYKILVMEFSESRGK
jgi:hypothetical protein